MAEYKGIKGFKVQYLDQDPVPAVAGWSSGGNMGTARKFSWCRNTNCTLAFGGYTPPDSTATEEYNGSSWTAGGALGTARRRFSRSRNTNSRFSIWWF
jgi:hypothetical protein